MIMKITQDVEVSVSARVYGTEGSDDWTLIVRWDRTGSVPFVKSHSFKCPTGMEPERVQLIAEAIKREMAAWLF